MRIHQFESELWLPRPRDEVFAFFSDASKLDAITPPWLHIQTITPAPIVRGSLATRTTDQE